MMRILTLVLATAVIPLTACGGGAGGGKTTTKLDAVEVQPGTISDNMILLDDSNVDGTAIDTSVPAPPAAPDKKQAGEAEASAETNAEPANDPEPEPADNRDDETAN